MKGLVNGTCLFLIYEEFRLGKWFECRSRKTAGARIPQHSTAAWTELPCLLLKARATRRAALTLNPAKLAPREGCPAVRARLSCCSDDFLSLTLCKQEIRADKPGKKREIPHQTCRLASWGDVLEQRAYLTGAESCFCKPVPGLSPPPHPPASFFFFPWLFLSHLSQPWHIPPPPGWSRAAVYSNRPGSTQDWTSRNFSETLAGKGTTLTASFSLSKSSSFVGCIFFFFFFFLCKEKRQDKVAVIATGHCTRSAHVEPLLSTRWWIHQPILSALKDQLWTYPLVAGGEHVTHRALTPLPGGEIRNISLL